jgi:hypothetical protein
MYLPGQERKKKKKKRKNNFLSSLKLSTKFISHQPSFTQTFITRKNTKDKTHQIKREWMDPPTIKRRNLSHPEIFNFRM